MSKVYPIQQHIAAAAHINSALYQSMYQQSIDSPASFWAEQARLFLSWEQPWDTVLDYDFPTGNIRWFEGGKLNVSVNCVDRHLPARAQQTAIIWEGDNPQESKSITYQQLHQEVCKFANVLKAQGVKKGDRVCIYLPMVAEAASIILACTRIGAVHSIVFGGFSADALRDRILDADCQVLICSDESRRGGKTIPVKHNADKAVQQCPGITSVIVVECTGNPIPWDDTRDHWYHELMADASSDCPAADMAAEDP